MDNYELYHKEASNLTAWRVGEEKKIRSNSNLSKEGQTKDLLALSDTYAQKKNDLKTRFQSDRTKERERLNGRLNGKPKGHSFRDRVRAKAQKDSSDYSLLTTENESHFALLEGIEEMAEAIRENTFVRSIGSFDSEGLNKRLSAAFESNDTQRIKWLRNHADSRGAQATVGAIDAHFEANRPPVERLAKEHIRKLDLYNEFFTQGLDLAEKTGQMPDFRGGESEQKIDIEIERIKKEIQNDNESKTE